MFRIWTPNSFQYLDETRGNCSWIGQGCSYWLLKALAFFDDLSFVCPLFFVCFFCLFLTQTYIYWQTTTKNLSQQSHQNPTKGRWHVRSSIIFCLAPRKHQLNLWIFVLKQKRLTTSRSQQCRFFFFNCSVRNFQPRFLLKKKSNQSPFFGAQPMREEAVGDGLGRSEGLSSVNVNGVKIRYPTQHEKNRTPQRIFRRCC